MNSKEIALRELLRIYSTERLEKLLQNKFKYRQKIHLINVIFLASKFQFKYLFSINHYSIYQFDQDKIWTLTTRQQEKLLRFLFAR